jgi:hypothetical protein
MNADKVESKEFVGRVVVFDRECMRESLLTWKAVANLVYLPCILNGFSLDPLVT